MKMFLGFAAGAVTGAFVYSKLTEEQRAGIAESVDSMLHRGRTGELVSAVSSGFGEVANAATGRVTEAADTVASTVADKLDSQPNDTVATDTVASASNGVRTTPRVGQ